MYHTLDRSLDGLIEEEGIPSTEETTLFRVR